MQQFSCFLNGKFPPARLIQSHINLYLCRKRFLQDLGKMISMAMAASFGHLGMLNVWKTGTDTEMEVDFDGFIKNKSSHCG